MKILAVRISALSPDNIAMPDKLKFTIDAKYNNQRLDKVLSDLCDDLSRARIQSLIRDGEIEVNGISETSPSLKIEAGDDITICIPDPVDATPKAEMINLDVIYEDGDLLVINKPAGFVVHPGAGNHDGTLVNALLHHCGDSLSGIGGVLRPGIVHRLDKDTSGLMVVAKNDKAHSGLSEQLSDRSLTRIYHALVLGKPMPPFGIIDKPIGRDLKNRQKMAVTAKNAKEAITEYKVLKGFNDVLSLVECKLRTGRTHQIRVHMAHNKYPLIGDPFYGTQKTALNAALKNAGYTEEVRGSIADFPRQALHAKEISFIHPLLNKRFSFNCDYPQDLLKLLKIL